MGEGILFLPYIGCATPLQSGAVRSRIDGGIMSHCNICNVISRDDILSYRPVVSLVPYIGTHVTFDSIRYKNIGVVCAKLLERLVAQLNVQSAYRATQSTETVLIKAMSVGARLGWSSGQIFRGVRHSLPWHYDGGVWLTESVVSCSTGSGRIGRKHHVVAN